MICHRCGGEGFYKAFADFFEVEVPGLSAELWPVWDMATTVAKDYAGRPLRSEMNDVLRGAGLKSESLMTLIKDWCSMICAVEVTETVRKRQKKEDKE